MANPEALADVLTQVFQNLKFQKTPVARLSKFFGRPKKQGDPTLDEWVEELEAYCRQLGIEGRDKVATALDHLGGVAKEEVACSPPADREDYARLLRVLRMRFGQQESVQSLNAAFYARQQQEGESLADFSRALMLFYNQIETAANDPQESEALARLREKALREQFIKGAARPYVRRELRKLEMDYPDLNFFEFREKSLKLYQDIDSTVRTESSYDGQTSVDRVVTPKSSQDACSDLQKLVEGQAKIAQFMEQTTEALKELTKVIAQSNNRPKFGKPNLQCSYCSKRGHEHADCFKRKNDQARKSNESQPNSNRPSPSDACKQGVQPNSGKATPLS